MKKVYFITDGVVDRNRNWGSKIDSIVENILKKQDYEIYTFYISKELDKLDKHSIENNSNFTQLVSAKLNLLEKNNILDTKFFWNISLFRK